MSTRTVTIVVVLTIIVGIVIFYQKERSADKIDYTTVQEQTIPDEDSDPDRENKLEPRHTPDEWKIYANSEWGLALAYPPDWKLITDYHRINLRKGCVPEDTANSCEHEISIGDSGTGLPNKTWYHPEYVVDGITAKTWAVDETMKSELIIVANNFQFWITTKDKNKTIVDEILSTVNFRE